MEMIHLTAEWANVLVGFGALLASFSAVVFARSAARAAVKSLAVTRQATELQLRPWLELLPEKCHLQKTGEQLNLTVRFVARNLGRLVLSDLRVAAVLFDTDSLRKPGGVANEVVPLALSAIKSDDWSTTVMPEGQAVIIKRVDEDLANLPIYTLRFNDGPPTPRMVHLKLAVAARYKWGTEEHISEFVKIFAVSAISKYPGPNEDITSHPFEVDRPLAQSAKIKNGQVILAT